MDAKRIPFSEEDERKIASAATWGLVVSLTSIGTAVLSAIATLSLDVEFVAIQALPAALSVLLNVWLLQASLAFRKVALTDVADQAFLLQGFRRLRGYFMFQVLLIVGGVLLGLFFGVFFARAF